MVRRKLGIAFWGVWTLAAIGCDPVQATIQPVRLRVIDSTSGQPVVGAQVEMKVDFDRDFPLSQKQGQEAKDEHARARAHWKDDLPWFIAVTDASGQANIEVKYYQLDRTWGSKPPAERDEVSGRPYLIRIKHDSSPEEEVSLLMRQGASIKGESYTVTVDAIQEPYYVKIELGGN